MAAFRALRNAFPAAWAAATTTRSDAPSAFGSGHFGRWIQDRFDLPAYLYTCDQTQDPKAFQPVNEAWRSSTDHIHQFGNDRVVAVASNYGYVQLRQDEGGPKFLNDYAPAEHRFGGGIGYLVDGTLVAGTHYPSSAAQSFERTFGTGYFCKQLRAGHYEMEQVIFAPFGDDPVLVSQVTIRNHSLAPAHPRWDRILGLPTVSVFLSLSDGSKRGYECRCDTAAPTGFQPAL